MKLLNLIDKSVNPQKNMSDARLSTDITVKYPTTKNYHSFIAKYHMFGFCKYLHSTYNMFKNLL